LEAQVRRQTAATQAAVVFVFQMLLTALAPSMLLAPSFPQFFQPTQKSETA